jgi:hypothetical protein
MKRVRAFLVALPVMMASVLSVLVMASPAHACSWRTAQQVSIYGGYVRLYVDGCGNAKAQLYDWGMQAYHRVDVYSSNHTYISFTRFGDYGAISNPVHVGSAQVAADGQYWSYSPNYYYAANTGYHSAY